MEPTKSAEESFHTLEETYRSIPEDEVLRMSMPPEHALAEAEQLQIVAREDGEALSTRNMPLDWIDQLSIASGGFAYAHASFESSIKKDSELTRT